MDLPRILTFGVALALAAKAADEGHEAAKGVSGTVGVLMETLLAGGAIVGIAGGDVEREVQESLEVGREVVALGQVVPDYGGEGAKALPVEAKGGADEHQGMEAGRDLRVVDGNAAVEEGVVERGGILSAGLVCLSVTDPAFEDVGELLLTILDKDGADDFGGGILGLDVGQGEVGQLEFLHAVEHGETEFQTDAAWRVTYLYDAGYPALEGAFLANLDLDIGPQIGYGESDAEAQSSLGEDADEVVFLGFGDENRPVAYIAIVMEVAAHGTVPVAVGELGYLLPGGMDEDEVVEVLTQLVGLRDFLGPALIYLLRQTGQETEGNEVLQLRKTGLGIMATTYVLALKLEVDQLRILMQHDIPTRVLTGTGCFHRRGGCISFLFHPTGLLLHISSYTVQWCCPRCFLYQMGPVPTLLPVGGIVFAQSGLVSGTILGQAHVPVLGLSA